MSAPPDEDHRVHIPPTAGLVADVPLYPPPQGLPVSRLPADCQDAAHQLREGWLAAYPEAKAYFDVLKRL